MDTRNLRSQAAVARLGAGQGKDLAPRSAYVDGLFRDTAYFSILEDEWPAVRARLMARLN